MLASVAMSATCLWHCLIAGPTRARGATPCRLTELTGVSWGPGAHLVMDSNSGCRKVRLRHVQHGAAAGRVDSLHERRHEAFKLTWGTQEQRLHPWS